MKRALFASLTVILIGSAFVWGTSGCGGTASDDPPDVTGTYDLTSTTCPDGAFDTVITVSQSGANIVLEGTHAGYIDATGTINNNGDFEVSNVNGTCDGRFSGGVGTATCTSDEGDDCDITYTRR